MTRLLVDTFNEYFSAHWHHAGPYRHSNDPTVSSTIQTVMKYTQIYMLAMRKSISNLHSIFGLSSCISLQFFLICFQSIGNEQGILETNRNHTYFEYGGGVTLRTSWHRTCLLSWCTLNSLHVKYQKYAKRFKFKQTFMKPIWRTFYFHSKGDSR